MQLSFSPHPAPARLLCALALSGTLAFAHAQQHPPPPAPYSQSSEFRSMLEEIHQPAPSPAFIATGHRPAANPRLSVQEQHTAGLHLRTTAQDILVDPGTGALQITDRTSSSSWTLTPAPDTDCPAASTSSTAATATAPAPTANPHEWTFSLSTPCGRLQLTLAVLDDGLARLTLADATHSAQGIRLGVQGGGPFFGLGERFWQAALTNTQLDVRPQDRYGEPGHNWTYVAVPFVYGPSGLGIYADTAFETDFRFNETASSFTLKSTGGPVTFFLFAAGSPEGDLTAYTAITGRPQNPPQWTFGPWITALGGKGLVLDAAHRIRTEAMPASALWIYDQRDEADNLGWPFWFSSFYGDPRQFVDTLHAQGFRVLTYVHPYVRAEMLPFTTPNPVFTKGLSDKLLMTDAEGKPAGPRFEQVPVGNVDFTNPAAVDWWQDMITGAVARQGFDGWMEDFGEWVRDSDRFAAGTGRTLSMLYPLLYHKITLRVAQGLNPDVVPFARSGAPGTQSFPTVLWGADQWPNWSRDYGLPSVVTAGITAGMSGYSNWGPDILSTGSSRDLWMRWVEFGALTPVMRDHVWDKPEHSINLWSDAEATAHFRRWAAFHSSLLPYFATYAAEAHRTGVPIMRHTVLEFPADPRSATAEYQYLLGHELLIAPVVEPGAELRTLYLPPGEWVNFWGGEYFTGGQSATVNAADTIPILVRAGSVLPFKPEDETARWNWNDSQLLLGSLVWHAFLSRTGHADATFTLPNGTSAHFTQNADTAVLEGHSPVARPYQVILRSALPPAELRLNGAVFPQTTPAPIGAPTAQWWWNPASMEIHALFQAADFKLAVTGVSATQYTR